MRKYGLQNSPERTKVRTEPPPKHHYQQQQQGRKVPVVYYLCKNGHLEHPHFIEVPLSSSEGLYLRDVINRLNVLRGKKIAAMYSWSCKRSYMNGFVWHDLAEDDLIHPVQGNEYVLKGSELLDQSPSNQDRYRLKNAKIHRDNHHRQDYSILRKPEVASSFSLTSFDKLDNVSSSSMLPPPPALDSLIRPRSAPVGQEDDSSPSTRRSGSSGDFCEEPSGRTAPSSAVGSPCATILKNCKTTAAHDASTQTDDIKNIADVGHTRMIGVPADDESLDAHRQSQRKCILQQKEVPEIVVEKRSPAPTSSSASSSWGTTGTLESLIRDEIKKRNSFSVVEEAEAFVPTRVKLKATDILIQLVSCGSIASKDHYRLGFEPTYTPRINTMKFTSHSIPNSTVLGEIDCSSESQRVIGLRQQEQYCTGRMVGATNHKETGSGISALKSFSSDKEGSCKISSSKRDKDKTVNGIQSRCLPRTMNIVSNKNSKNDIDETTMSPIVDTKKSSVGSGCCGSSPISSTKIGSNRITDSFSVKGSSKRFEMFREEKEKVTKIEERLTSGARVVIQCRSPCYDE